MWSAKSSLHSSLKDLPGWVKDVYTKPMNSTTTNNFIEFGGWIGLRKGACHVMKSVSKNMQNCRQCGGGLRGSSLNVEHAAHVVFATSLTDAKSDFFGGWFPTPRMSRVKQKLDHSNKLFHTKWCDPKKNREYDATTYSTERTGLKDPMLVLNSDGDKTCQDSSENTPMLHARAFESKFILLVREDLTKIRLPVDLICPHD